MLSSLLGVFIVIIFLAGSGAVSEFLRSGVNMPRVKYAVMIPTSFLCGKNISVSG